MDRRIFFTCAFILLVIWIMIPIVAYVFKKPDILGAWAGAVVLSILFGAWMYKEGSNLK